MNRSGFKGVSLHVKSDLWRARLAGKTIGYYQTAEEAAKAYDEAAIRYFGQFALINFRKETT
jgi:hypothetical protein